MLASSHVRQETLFTFISFLCGRWEVGEREKLQEDYASHCLEGALLQLMRTMFYA